MPTPTELARLVEQFDDAEWYDFLEELDAVTRRRRQRQGEPEQPAGVDRDAVARWIARKHFLADSGVREIWYLPQDAPASEIRLLEVSERLSVPEMAAPQIQAIDFALDMQGNPFRLFVADVTGDETEQIKAGHLSLPPGWTLAGNVLWRRRV